jgi:hypothetical protein
MDRGVVTLFQKPLKMDELRTDLLGFFSRYLEN